ncbi:TetR/AcrR family transcriptional regulator [Nakamurella endophytica]|uniref:Transcriptional regulator, TetR family protein n=1 Tax=Nakamurella endophytica TaxID=1748367 RepID=A0A917SN59_9ACTN|nr:TetR/AcrR family transcriptional regulator C-terminal domain-containing protein [Nakamurella endophytica]GGL88592.1 putative transcriptional regulator, TetR family protein [Nakamurella endophytica]
MSEPLGTVPDEDATPDPDSPEGLGRAASPVTDAAVQRSREPLSRRLVLVNAVGLIDEEGLAALTMRRLGARLGVEAMALYRYVTGREDLLDGIVELLVDDLYGDPDVHMEADVWQEYLQRLAHGVRRLALAHPLVFPVVATRPPAAPWVRPPLRSLRWMESFLEQLQRSGFSDWAAVESYRAFSSFLLGHLLLEVSARGAEISPVEQNPPDTPRRTDLSSYPRLQALEPELSQDHSAEVFDESLEALLDRLEVTRRTR